MAAQDKFKLRVTAYTTKVTPHHKTHIPESTAEIGLPVQELKVINITWTIHPENAGGTYGKLGLVLKK